ncbi:MAG: hypothetical protein DPW18_13095 [Chloroflexi bacterium]|nr:hypothetical protein [Chloroflexota bacterium]MDL1941993.1 hypothetical protein [Chloroflexi bacterium CFX2]
MNQKNNVITGKIHPVLWHILTLTAAILVFVLILASRSPFFLRPASMALRTGFGIIMPIAALVLYAVFRVPGRLGQLLSLTAVMALFALGLAGLWASGNTQTVVLSGLIPLTDAAEYYTDAIRLQHGVNVSSFTAMRPFFAGLLSFLLWLSERNLMTAVGVFTAIAGFSCYLACRELQRTHGAEAAVFFLILMFLYYRHHSGTTMSESLGVTVGLFGAALLWRGISTQKEWSVLFGIGVIALALNIRPGAMFVLPALLLWGGWIFRGQGRFSFKFFGLGTTIILLVFYANNKMIDFVAGPGGMAFENFAWAFYGLASGGKSWTYIFEAHPELGLLKDTEVTPAIYRLAFDLILTDPSLIVKGALHYWRMFFSNTWYNAYAFVAGENYWVNEAARWAMYILGGLGIFKWFKERRDPYASLAVAAALGVLASVPFVPPTDAYRVRLYAATIPFFVLLPGMGLLFLQEKFPAHFFKPRFSALPDGYPIAAFAGTLVVLILAAPVFIKTNGKLPIPPGGVCPAELDSFFTSFDEGIAINIQRESEVFLDWVPDFHASIFRRNAHSIPDTNLVSILESIAPLNTIFYAVDLQTNRAAFVIIETALLPKPGALIHLCGNLNYDPEITPYAIFYAEQVVSTQER